MALTEREKEVLTLLINSYKTPKEVAATLNINISRVYKYIQRLKKKGELIGSMNRGYNKPILLPQGGYNQDKKSTLISYGKLKRLHGEEWNIKLNTRPEYKGKNPFIFKGARVKVFTKSIRVWAKTIEFIEETVDKCTQASMNFWPVFFTQLEDKYAFNMLKPGATQITRVDHEIEEVSSEWAKASYKRQDNQLKFRGSTDGMVWFTTDKSFNRDNSECPHPRKATDDANLIFENIYNSWRDKKAYTPLQATQAIGELTNITKSMYDGFRQEMRSHLMLLRQEIKGIKKEGKARKGVQENLQRWL